MRPMLHLEYARKIMQAYENASKPLCAVLGISPTSFDILMFLANNPTRNTAKDIAELKGIKANLISIHVEKLVQEGFLQRSKDKKDRRRVLLSCTPKAAPLIQRGLELQKHFYDRLLANVPADSLEVMRSAIGIISRNIDEISQQ